MVTAADASAPSSLCSTVAAPDPTHATLAPRRPLCAAAWDTWVGQHAERVHARAQCGRAAAFWRLARLIAATNAWQEACL